MWISKVGKLHELVFGEKSASLAIEAAADFVFIETDTSRNGTVEMQTQFRPRQSHKPADTQSPLLIWFRRTDIVVCMCCLSGCFPIFLVWTWHSDFLEFGSKPKPLSDRLQEVKQPLLFTEQKMSTAQNTLSVLTHKLYNSSNAERVDIFNISNQSKYFVKPPTTFQFGESQHSYQHRFQLQRADLRSVYTNWPAPSGRHS